MFTLVWASLAVLAVLLSLEERLVSLRPISPGRRKLNVKVECKHGTAAVLVESGR